MQIELRDCTDDTKSKVETDLSSAAHTIENYDKKMCLRSLNQLIWTHTKDASPEQHSLTTSGFVQLI